MTEQEWKRRCVKRIYAAVKKAGRIRIRDLKRATNYNRGGLEEGGIAVWYEALDSLERRKFVVCERDADGLETFVLLPSVAEVLKLRPSKISDL